MKVGFIGCGNMGGALARAVRRAGHEVLLYDKNTAGAELLAKEIEASVVNISDVCLSDYVFLGVKPNIIPAVLSDIASKITDKTVLISMAAGVSTEKIEAIIGKAKVIRIMPNTPVTYGAGMILYTATESVTEDETEGFLSIMSKAGKLDRLQESLIDAGSAVSGCGPAFVYMFIEALADGGVASGLTRDKALEYAARTVLGAATMLLESGKHPGELKDAVCSPGGSTIEGVLALESGSMRAVVSDAVIASYEKTKKLGK